MFAETDKSESFSINTFLLLSDIVSTFQNKINLIYHTGDKVNLQCMAQMGRGGRDSSSARNSILGRN